MWLLQYIRIGYEHVFINHVITSITNYIDYYGNIITNVLIIIYLRIFTYSNIPPQI